MSFQFPHVSKNWFLWPQPSIVLNRKFKQWNVSLKISVSPACESPQGLVQSVHIYISAKKLDISFETETKVGKKILGIF